MKTYRNPLTKIIFASVMIASLFTSLRSVGQTAAIDSSKVAESRMTASGEA